MASRILITAAGVCLLLAAWLTRKNAMRKRPDETASLSPSAEAALSVRQSESGRRRLIIENTGSAVALRIYFPVQHRLSGMVVAPGSRELGLIDAIPPGVGIECPRCRVRQGTYVVALCWLNEDGASNIKTRHVVTVR